MSTRLPAVGITLEKERGGIQGSCDVLVLVNAGSKDLTELGVLLAVLLLEILVDKRLDVVSRKSWTLDGNEE
jgi:hypothetical protein